MDLSTQIETHSRPANHSPDGTDFIRTKEALVTLVKKNKLVQRRNNKDRGRRNVKDRGVKDHGPEAEGNDLQARVLMLSGTVETLSQVHDYLIVKNLELETEIRDKAIKFGYQDAMTSQDFQSRFAIQEKWVKEAAGVLESIGAADAEIKATAELLRTRPRDLRAKVAMHEIGFLEALDELVPLPIIALKMVAKAMIKTRVEARANYLAYLMQKREDISTPEVQALLANHENCQINSIMALRAMNKAAKICPRLECKRAGKSKILTWKDGIR